MLAATFLCVVALLASTSHSTPVQQVLETPSLAARPRQLHGRFLHITDLHPDPFYEAGTSISKYCHRNTPKNKKNRAGYYGTPYSECDSPLRLTNYTLDFLEKNWAGEIDFVVWTGDNARHGDDNKIPRTLKEIYETNRAVVKKMNSVFASKGIPVIPSLGNNDIWPHNILDPGPNRITNEFSSIWGSYIPFQYHQVFQRGAYYAVEVVPNALAVISLNTMYFYDSNKAVGGCNYNQPDDPGNLEMDWLEVQLKIFRDRGMQVWLTGHVPPSRLSYFPECYVRYVNLALKFQDTVLGHLYGHMNTDHFFFVEAADLELDTYSRDNLSKHKNLYKSLLEEFALLPQPKKIDLDEYAIINVSPSLVPNPYLPTFRIFTYNITNVEGALASGSPVQEMGQIPQVNGRKSSLCEEERYQDSWKCKLEFNPPSNPNAPSRKSKLWTPLGYAQYYIPKLEDADKADHPRFRLEYTTFPAAMLRPGEGQNETEFQYPVPLKNLPKSIQKGEIKKKYFPYEMKDLTVGSWMSLARRLGDKKENGLRKKFKQFMYLEL